MTYETINLSYVIPLTSEDRIRVRSRLTTDGRVIDFAHVQQTWIGVAWLDVTKIDSAHGYVHQHRYTMTGGEVVVNLEYLDNAHRFGQAAKRALYEMMADWEDEKRRWRDG